MEHKSDHILSAEKEEQPTVVMRKRQKFVEDFCRRYGWDSKQLSFEQLMEIRKNDGWKNLQ
jgi:hypothetical protein